MKFVLVLFVGVLWSTPQLCRASCSLGVYEDRLPTGVEAKSITDAHNNKRLLIARGQVHGQPRGINLKKLIWDWDLAKAALNIAKTCNFAHVLVKDNRFPWVGQNLYKSMSTANSKGAKWDEAVNAWFNEHKLYRFPQDSNEKTGHYTQLVWANTAYVGCAYVYFPANDKFKYQKFYVCNYGPGGNIRGQAPYKTGKTGCENLC